jgi:hypothetical protein
MKIVINSCYGGFGISQEGYKKLIEWGIPERPYIDQKWDEETKRYLPEPRNEGEIIFNNGDDRSKYWDTWTRGASARGHPLIVRLVEELGEKANGQFARLKVIEIPDGTPYTIEEYDGIEHVAEVHRTWS